MTGLSLVRVTVRSVVATFESRSPSLTVNSTCFAVAGWSLVLLNLTSRSAVCQSDLVALPVSVRTPVPELYVPAVMPSWSVNDSASVASRPVVICTVADSRCVSSMSATVRVLVIAVAAAFSV